MGYELKDRVVLITGASGGIGRACASVFHQAGSRVVVVARSIDKLKTLADELGGDRVLPIELDVTNAEQRKLALRKIREKYGTMDVLINNAGWASFASILYTPDEHIERMWQLNFVAPVALTQAVLPDMLKQGHGQIINISSVAGYQAIPRMGIYSATKSAINSLTTALRMELKGTGVDVLLIAPGSTNTDFFSSAALVDTKPSRLAQTQYSPQRVARAIIRASKHRKREVILTADGIAITILRRLSRRLADRIMYQVAKRAMPIIDHNNT